MSEINWLTENPVITCYEDTQVEYLVELSSGQHYVAYYIYLGKLDEHTKFRWECRGTYISEVVRYVKLSDIL